MKQNHMIVDYKEDTISQRHPESYVGNPGL